MCIRDRGRDELIEQATAAGFALMQDDQGIVDEAGNRTELWTGTNEEGMTIFLDVGEDQLTVNLFLDG